MATTWGRALCASSGGPVSRRGKPGGLRRWGWAVLWLLIALAAGSSDDDGFFAGDEDAQDGHALDLPTVQPAWDVPAPPEVAGDSVPLVPFMPEERGHGGSKRWKHHRMFPLTYEDWWGLFFIAIGLMIAAGGGIGGGGILVPILILVMGFSPKYAIPLSNVTILGGSIMNMVMNVKKRHPLADRPLVDWDLILIMEPLTIGGALAGSFLNKVLPEWVLVILLVALLSFTAQNTLDKGFKVYRRETEAMIQAAKAPSFQLKELHVQEAGDQEEEERAMLLPAEECDNPEQNAAKAELQAILDSERETPWHKVGLLVFCFIVVLALNLAKGGGAFKSPLGIRCGSFTFWFVTTLVFAWVVAVSLYVRANLLKMYYLKARVGYNYVKGDIEWDEWATIKYPCLCFFAGFFAGMFGVGGGIVKGPLMLEMGVTPQVASASSACMILFTSFTATTSFYIFDLLVYDYAFWLFMIGFACTSVGQFGLTYLMKKYNRSSYIIFSIGAVVGLSALLMGLQSIISLWTGTSGGAGSICDAAA